MNKPLTIILSCLAFAAATTGPVFAHPNHVCIAELEVTGDAQPQVQVAILARVVDITKAVDRSATNESGAEGETGRELDERIARYLEKKFVVRDQDGTQLPMTWVGKEFNDDNRKTEYWLYVSLQPRGRPTMLNVSNTLFMDLEDDQINMVTFKHRETVRVVRYTSERPQRTMLLRAPATAGENGSGGK